MVKHKHHKKKEEFDRANGIGATKINEKRIHEESLSEKIWENKKRGISPVINVKDVKEFIRLQNILFDQLYRREINWSDFTAENNKLAGEKLI